VAIKFIKQDAAVLLDAYNARKDEYEALRATGKWSGAIYHAGVLVELALKLVICKNIGETKLPVMFQIHDLDLLLYCSGQRNNFLSQPNLRRNFDIVNKRWSMELRYKGATQTQADSDLVHQALLIHLTEFLLFYRSTFEVNYD